jgi:hypothetical protein
MSTVVEKQVQVADYRAKRLEQLAAERGVTENALIEEALDLLFREQERQAAREEALREDWEQLRQLEAELGPIPPSSRPVLKINPEDIVPFAGTPIDPDRIRRIGD